MEATVMRVPIILRRTARYRFTGEAVLTFRETGTVIADADYRDAALLISIGEADLLVGKPPRGSVYTNPNDARSDAAWRARQKRQHELLMHAALNQRNK